MNYILNIKRKREALPPFHVIFRVDYLIVVNLLDVDHVLVVDPLTA